MLTHEQLVIAQDCMTIMYPVTLAVPGGFLRFLETGHDSDSTDQIVNSDGPLPAAVTVNKTRYKLLSHIYK